MSVIGKQIKKYRVAKGLTQEQLGNLLGVTTQAVSKWERGGTPDAELLPSISQALCVSIDTLFGLKDDITSEAIARRMSQMPEEEAYHFAFNLCFAISSGIMYESKPPENFSDDYLDRLSSEDSGVDWFSKIMTDNGMALSRLSHDFHYFFLMKEPESGLKARLSDMEKLRKVFEIFADKKMLSIIFYMYSRLNTPVATSLISKNTGISEKEVDSLMEGICENNLATKSIIETTNGEIFAYMFNQESSVIPLLCYADELTRTKFFDYMWSFRRTKPLLE